MRRIQRTGFIKRTNCACPAEGLGALCSLSLIEPPVACPPFGGKPGAIVVTPRWREIASRACPVYPVGIFQSTGMKFEKYLTGPLLSIGPRWRNKRNLSACPPQRSEGGATDGKNKKTGLLPSVRASLIHPIRGHSCNLGENAARQPKAISSFVIY